MTADKFHNSYVPEPNTGCLLWIRTRDECGYGTLYFPPGQSAKCRRVQKAHRVAWMLKHGAIPDGLQVLHKCDTPSCVNPDHLFLGTHTDNMRDMFRKKRRSMIGEQNSNRKLTEADVRAIREACAAGETQESVGRRFGVIQCHISDIVNRKRWSNVEQ